MAVVDTCGVEGCQTVLNGTDLYISLEQHCSTLCLSYILCKRFNYGLGIKIRSLYLVAVVCGCGIECHSQVKTCVKALAA